MGSWESNVLAHVYDCPECVSDPMDAPESEEDDEDL